MLLHKLLITGSTGLVGSRFVELFKSNFSITTIGRNNTDIQIDLASEEEVRKSVHSSDANAVINFAAYTNVDEAEKEKGDTKGEVYTINTLLPFWLANSCQDSGKKLYHISTDYVFDGKKQDEPYTETDTPSLVDSWYATTKCKGELEVLKTFKKNENFSIIRISYPYSGTYERKLDVARTVINKLTRNEPYFGITDQKVKPTSVDDIANALLFLISKDAYGIYHVAGNYNPEKYVTPYEFAQKIADIFKLDKSLIKPISFIEYSKKRIAPRPQNTWLNTRKIELLGFKITHIDEALKRFKNQMLNI